MYITRSIGWDKKISNWLSRESHIIDAPESILNEKGANASILDGLPGHDEIDPTPQTQHGFEAIILGTDVYKNAFSNALISSADSEYHNEKTISRRSLATARLSDPEEAQWIPGLEFGAHLLSKWSRETNSY